MSGVAPIAGAGHSTRHLVDPELLPALDSMPSFIVDAGTLADIRQANADVRVPAPPAPDVTMEERRVPGPDGTTLRLLVYTPEASKPSGGLVWLHGGGMVMASPDNNDPLCRHLAQTAGCVVVAVDYRLAPEHPHPAALEDSYVALRWMHANADELGIPADRLAVSGESGGGCLAAGLAIMAHERGEMPLSAQFLLYPMLDDRTGTPSDPSPMPYSGEFVWTRESNRFAWGAVLGRAPGGEVAIQAAPGRARDLTGLPPTTILVGSLDLFIGENLRFAQTLVQSGVTTALHVYPGAYHGFVSFAQDADVSKRAFAEFTGAIERHFKSR